MTTDPRVAWSNELRTAGRVCADVRRGNSVYLLFVVGIVAVMGGWGLGAAGIDVVGRAFAGVMLLGAAGLGMLGTEQLLRLRSWRSPQVVVDADGVTVRHGYLQIPWADLVAAVPYLSRGNKCIALGISAERYDAWLAQRSRVARALGHRWRRRPYGQVYLPPNLDVVDYRAFAAWLTAETLQRRSGQA